MHVRAWHRTWAKLMAAIIIYMAIVVIVLC